MRLESDIDVKQIETLLGGVLLHATITMKPEEFVKFLQSIDYFKRAMNDYKNPIKPTLVSSNENVKPIGKKK
jgi:hypothetical protein